LLSQLTRERRLSALRSIQSGTLYDVSHEIRTKAPGHGAEQTPFLIAALLRRPLMDNLITVVRNPVGAGQDETMSGRATCARS